MVYKRIVPGLAPDKDAGWGLIFRLNSLWARVDSPAESGDYDHWNIILDRIFCNLLYRNPMQIITDENGKVTDVKIAETDLAYKVFNFHSLKIFQAKIDYHQSLVHHKPVPYIKIMKSRWYHAVMMKDIWLRKYMQELGLYLKEIEKSPGTALFGGTA